MRAIYFNRICPTFNRPPSTRLLPPINAIQQFHSSRLRATEEASAPRQRGRPRKIKTEETVIEAVAAAETIETEVEPLIKFVKPRKKPPKISDIARLIPPTSITPSTPRSLRPYQEECVDACLKAISEGKRRLGISLATGAGKTVIFTNLIGKVQLENTKRYQTLILVHRRELVEQAARHCVEVYPDKVAVSRECSAHRRRWRSRCRIFILRGRRILRSVQCNRCFDPTGWPSSTRIGRK